MLCADGYLDSTGQRHPLGRIDRILTRGSARLDQLPLALYRNREKTLFSSALVPDPVARRASLLDADLFHLHWINNGLMRVETLSKLKKPIVWTLHDMWPFTGGCHYSYGCDGYMHSCGACPQLHSDAKIDLSRRIFERKMAAWDKSRFDVIAPSQWIARAAASSALLRRNTIHAIPNAIDSVAFTPIDKGSARDEFGVPRQSFVLLFGALTGDGDKRKGYHFLRPLLAKLAERHPDRAIHLVVLGLESPQSEEPYPFPVTHLGFLREDKAIARAYSTADLLVVPSVEDNLPNSVMEAGSCAVPAVAFNIGGLPDMIEHKRTGYLAKPFDIDDLAAGVISFANDRVMTEQAGLLARQHAIRKYSYGVVAKRHEQLYSNLLGRGD